LSKLNAQLAEAAARIAAQGRVVALTGAGISVESSIPDFRSRGGLWTRFPPEEYATIHAFMTDPAKVWRMFNEMEKVLDRASPNPGHLALAELESLGLLDAIVTQNIDGLHQRAGSARVIEFHGSHRTLTCQWCGAKYRREDVARSPSPSASPPLASLASPPCSCGKLLKPDVVLFGEMIPTRALEDADQYSATCNTMIVVGTSAEVAPASQMPLRAKRAGATIIEVNIEPTHLTGHCTDIFLEGKAGVVLPRLVEQVKKITAG
jgi:NAD-dependent deacetylase